MSAGGGSDKTSPFDRMLAESRDRFDALLRRPRADIPGSVPATPREPPRSVERGRPIPATPSAADPAPAAPRERAGRPPGEAPFDVRATDIGRMLASRYGEGWSFEAVDRRRDGEDVVVWCRLTVAARDHDKTRRGRARVKGARKPASAAGRAGSAGFVVMVGDSAVTDQAAADQAASDEATRQALAACAKGL